ncbi:MAG TPA: MFS transporter [Polyangiaceae bacterium]|nr:MFS transporter [Polyangiaceae bacterium]
MREFFDAFKALRGAPRALWLVIFAFSLESMAYFGILPLMKPYLSQDIGISPALASTWVSIFTGALTLVMLFVGKPAEDKLGIRKGILVALLLIIAGRALYGSAPFVGGALLLAVSLVVVALGEGVLQPIAYAGVKKYTSEKNGAMGYAVLYSFFNLGAALIGPISAGVRTTFDDKHKAGTTALSGFNAVNWVCFAITVGTLLVFGALMTKKAEANVVRLIDAAPTGAGEKPVVTASPFRDKRFMFFIFMLLPVRTLFAHQWLTMPEYVLRAYPKEVGDRMEWLVDSVNPIIIFFGVPLLTALTKRAHVLTMMIIGSGVSAMATFLLCGGPSTPMLIGYFCVFSIGEALWSSRFLEYAAELAPPGRTAQYMGIANLPWFVAKTTTGFYSGWVLERFCPKNGPQHTEVMWLIYGLVALASPLGLLLARKWVLAGMGTKAAPKPEPAPEAA